MDCNREVRLGHTQPIGNTYECAVFVYAHIDRCMYKNIHIFYQAAYMFVTIMFYSKDSKTYPCKHMHKYKKCAL